MKILVLKIPLVVLLFALAGCAGGFGRHKDLLVADQRPVSAAHFIPTKPPRDGVRITYLGTNAYLLESAEGTVLIDPYFTRVSIWPVLFNCPIRRDDSRISRGMEKLPPRADLILVTHGHVDHLLDAPEISRRTGARIVASPTSCFQAEAVGVLRGRLFVAREGGAQVFGSIKVHFLRADHDRILGVEPYAGTRDRIPKKPLRRMSDWKCGEPLAFVIEMGGKRIYVDSGGWRTLPPAGFAPVDLAILGVAVKDSQQRFMPAVNVLRPCYVLPSHQDDFFRPLDDGFHFLPSANPNGIRDAFEKSGAPGKLILLDYYKPWTLK